MKYIDYKNAIKSPFSGGFFHVCWLKSISRLQKKTLFLWRFWCSNLILPNGYVHVILLDFYDFAKLIVPYLANIALHRFC